MKILKLLAIIGITVLLGSLIYLRFQEQEDSNSQLSSSSKLVDNDDYPPYSMEAGYALNDTVQDFSLTNVDGRLVSLHDYKDSPGAVVVFISNDCPYSNAYEERLIVLDKTFSGSGYPVIAINSRSPYLYPLESLENMKKRSDYKGFPFPYLQDLEKIVLKQFGVKTLPQIFVLQNKDQKFVVKYVGAIDDNYANENSVKNKFAEFAIKGLVNGNDIKRKSTVPVGCSIDKSSQLR